MQSTTEKPRMVFLIAIGAALLILCLLITAFPPWKWAAHKSLSKAGEKASLVTAKLSAKAAARTKREGFNTAPTMVLYRSIEEAPSWAVAYGQEFWRRPASVLASGGGQWQQQATPVPANFNLGEVMERVSRAITREDQSKSPHANTKSFDAGFDGEGLRFSPHRVAIREDGTPRLVADPSTEAIFRTLAVQQGSETVYRMGSGPVQWSVVGNTAQGLLSERAGLVEHYEVRNEGVEVSWVFTQRLPSDGDLQIEAQLTGLTYNGQSEAGHHFVDSEGRPRVRVGQILMVDARGQRTELNLLADGAKLSVRVGSELLAKAVFPIAIDPTISPEFGMGVAMANYRQLDPAVASDGTNFFAVWDDSRSGDGSFLIYGTRVTSEGKVSDPGGIVVSTTGANPAVASDGTNYLVVWEDASGANQAIYGTRVSSAGIVLDTNHLAICTNSSFQSLPKVAGKSGGYFPVWQDTRNSATNYDVYGTRVTSGGIVLEPSGILVGKAANAGSEPAVAVNGTNYLVIWLDFTDYVNFDIFGARVTDGGVVLDTNPILITSNIVHYAIAGDGTNWLAVWADGYIYGRRISSAGAILDTNAITITTAPADHPRAAGNASGYLVAWVDQRNSSKDVFGARVSDQGAVLDPAGLAISTVTSSVSKVVVASSKSEYLVIWEDDRNASTSDTDIYGARLTTAGDVLDSIAISTVASENNNQTYPAVASNGTNYLVAWEDDRNSSTNGLDIFGTRVRTDGVILDLSGIAICTITNQQERPAIASNGTNYLVVWQDNRDSTNYNIYGTRITSDGTVLDSPTNLVLSIAAKDQQYPGIGSLGGNYLVTWQDYRGVYYDIYGTRVTAGGTVQDTAGIAIHTLAGAQRVPKVSGIGTNYFVVWFDQRPNDMTSYDVYGARVTTGGSVVDANGIAICTASSLQYYPWVSTDNTDYLVVWQDFRNSAWDIYGARVTSGMTVLDTNGIAICTATNAQQYPSVACLGTNYLVAWSDSRNSTSSPDIYGTRVTSSGTIVDTPNLAISTGANTQIYPAVAANRTNYLVVFQSNASATNRIRGNLITP